MEKGSAMATAAFEQVMKASPDLVAISHRVWMDYDEEADVLYMSFRKPQQATDSEMEGNVIYHHNGEELVGITVMGFKVGWNTLD